MAASFEPGTGSGRDEVRGIAVNRSFHTPGEAALLEHALREHVGLVADIGDDEQGQDRKSDSTSRRGLRRERRGRSEGQPRRPQQSDADGAEHSKPRRTRKESRSHRAFLGRKGMKLNPLKGQ